MSVDSSITSTVDERARGGGGVAGSASAVQLVRRYIESLPHQPPFGQELRSAHLWKAVWTEFVGTMLFVVIGCGCGIRWTSSIHEEDASADLKASLAVGLTMAALIRTSAHISGCHLNPAVSITLLVTRSISPLRTVSYAVAQCLGAVVGAAVLYGLTPAHVRQTSAFPVTVLRPDVHPSQAFGVEFLITLLVIITLMAGHDTTRADTTSGWASVGVAYTVGHLFGYRYTGASMNPARSFGLALISNTWANQWVYWVGPIMGGIIGGITYEYIRTGRSSRGQPEVEAEDERKEWMMGRQVHPPQSRMIAERYLRRDESAFSCSADTQLTPNSNDLRI